MTTGYLPWAPIAGLRQSARAALCLCSVLLACAPSWAQRPGESWPGGMVTIVVGTAAGSSEDAMARALQKGLQVQVRGDVVVENTAGASGLVAAVKAGRATPNGRTLLFSGITSQVIVPTFSRNPLSDAVRDLVPITKIGRIPIVLVVRADGSVRSFQDLLAAAGRKAGALTYGSPGVATLPHLFGEQLGVRSKVNLLHVPFKGNVPAVQELYSGNLDAVLISAAVALPLIRDQRLLPLAVSGQRDYPQLPNVPLFAKVIGPDLDAEYWYGLFGPARLDRNLAATIGTEAAKALKEGSIAAQLRDLGLDVETSDPAKFAALVAAENGRWTAVAKRSAIRVD